MNPINVAVKFAIFSLFGYLFFLIIKPFIPAFVLALTFAMVFYPLSKKLQNRARMSNDLSAVLTVILTLIFIVLPMIALVVMIGNEALNFAKTTDLEMLQQNLVNLKQVNLFGFSFDVDLIKAKLLTLIESIGAYLSTKSVMILSSIWESIFMFFVFILLYYYFLKDSKKLLADLHNVLPYDNSQKKELFSSFQRISRTIFYGNLISASMAGLVAYVGFSIFGLSGALIWALLAAILSFIPTAGTLLLYLTGITLLFFINGWISATLMLLYYVAVELIGREQFINAKVLENKLEFHPINIFFALVGGVLAFGSLGLVYGPLIITFLGTLYQFHTTDSKK